ncbi:hypothetical protein [Bacillus paranthracis]|uniref:hypothetical protein n=1 Tax=Bacillus paranthracis TaxID=2026186 RepID=UPI00298D2805|nr:hypothetical protein [Bacillus paranthracis]
MGIEIQTADCEECGGSGFNGLGTGYDSVCDSCGGRGEHPIRNRNDSRIGMQVSSVFKDRVYVGELNKHGIFAFDRIDITEDFKRCIVQYCKETVEFEIDGMKFKATCEKS